MNDTVQILRAGEYLEGRWQDHYTADYYGDTYREFERYWIRGRLESASSSLVAYTYDWGRLSKKTREGWTVYEEGATEGSGRLEFTRSRATVALRIEDGGSTYDFTKVSPAPRLHDLALESMAAWSRRLQHSMQEAPLHSDEKGDIEAAMDTLAASLDTWAIAGGIDRMQKAIDADAQLGSDLGMHIAERYGDIQASSDQLEAVRLHCRHQLQATLSQAGGTSKSSWLLAISMVSEYPHNTKYIQHFLDIEPPRSEGDLFYYRWRTLVESGISGDVIVAGGGGNSGFIQLQRITGDLDAPTVAWDAKLPYVSGNVSMGLSGGVDVATFMSQWSTLATTEEWRQEDFRGGFSVLQTTLGGAIFIGASYGGGEITFYGDGNRRPVRGPTDGWAGQAGLFIGIETSETWGFLFDEGEEPDPSALNGPDHAALAAEDYYEAMSGEGFEVDDATVSEDAREALRRFCAAHLAGLQGRFSFLEITGHTSRSDTAEYNLALSRRRAGNVAQAVRDILGPNLGIGPANTTIVGLGEVAAEAAGEPDGIENETWRKTDVELDGLVELRF